MTSGNEGTNLNKGAISAGNAAPGGVIRDAEKRELHAEYSLHKGHIATCSMEMCYNLLPEESSVAAALRPIGYDFIGEQAVDGVFSPHAATMLANISEEDKKSLIFMDRTPRQDEDPALKAGTRFVFAKVWEALPQKKTKSAVSTLLANVGIG